jgi:hypothetical protein
VSVTQVTYPIIARDPYYRRLLQLWRLLTSRQRVMSLVIKRGKTWKGALIVSDYVDGKCHTKSWLDYQDDDYASMTVIYGMELLLMIKYSFVNDILWSTNHGALVIESRHYITRVTPFVLAKYKLIQMLHCLTISAITFCLHIS